MGAFRADLTQICLRRFYADLIGVFARRFYADSMRRFGADSYALKRRTVKNDAARAAGIAILDYSGTFPCFLFGLATALFSSMAKALMSLRRVSRGWITSSMKPRAAAR